MDEGDLDLIVRRRVDWQPPATDSRAGRQNVLTTDVRQEA
jgi:hypothetical protein